MGPTSCAQTLRSPLMRYKRMEENSFGFKPRSGCAEALFVMRREFERFLRSTDHGLALLSLNLKLAFDRVSREAAKAALEAWGFWGGMLTLLLRPWGPKAFYNFPLTGFCLKRVLILCQGGCMGGVETKSELPFPWPGTVGNGPGDCRSRMAESQETMKNHT